MNSARDRNLAASGNLAQRWGWEAVPEGEVHLAPGCKTPGTITHWQPCSSGSRHTAQVCLVSGLSQPRHSRYPAAGCTQTMLRRRGQAKHRLQPPKTAAGHPATCTRCCSSGQHLGGPARVFWSGNHLFLFFPPPNKEDDSWTECFGGIFLPALFLGMNSMLVNMENNIGILTLQPMVSYALSAIPQPGAAWGLPSASLTSSWWPSLWSEKRVRSPDPIKFEVFLLKLLKTD